MVRHMNHLIHVKKSLFRKIFLFFLILIIFFIAAFTVAYRYFVGVYESEIRATYESSLLTIAGSTDTMLREIYQNTYLLASDPDLMDLLYVKDKFPIQQYSTLSRVRDLLGRLLNSKEMLDNISIILKDANLVVSTSGSANLHNYLTSLNVYEEYPERFWLEFRPEGAKYHVLKPTRVVNHVAGSEKRTIPLLIQEIGNYSIGNLLIIDLKSDYFTEMLDDHKLTENSLLYIINKDGTVFGQSHAGPPPRELASPDFAAKLQPNRKQTFTHRINGRDMLVIASPSRNAYLNGYSYVACVPYSDLDRRLSFIKSFSYSAIATILSLAVVMSYLMSRRIYRPIQSLAMVLRSNRSMENREEEISRDELDFINSRINLILDNNEALAKDLSAVVPLIQEKYLLRLLNSDSLLPDTELENFWKKSDVVFPHQHFLVATAELGFTDGFYNQFDSRERSSILGGIRKIFVQVFPKHWQIYLLTDKNRLCLIVNLPADNGESVATECLRKFHDIFSFDRDLLSLSIGIGSIHPDYSGVHMSYKESLKALSTITPYSKVRIKSYRDEKEEKPYHLHIEEENRLYNFLMGGYRGEASALLKEIVERNEACELPEPMLKELYLRLFHIGLKVTRAKSLSIEDVMKEETVNPAVNTGSISPQELLDYITTFYARLSEASEVKTRTDIQDIIRYINEHYDEDLYLDRLADRYGTSGKYLSRLLKNALGIPFQQYLAHLRITKAKEMLRSTPKPIHEIAAATGFNNKNTFIRMFKKWEGIPPSEYRAYHKETPPD